jgi:zinc-ribbon domain
MAERLNALVTAGDLRRLVELRKLPLAAHSPLRPVMDLPPADNDAALQGQGLLGDPWRTVLATLANPAQEIRTIVPTPSASVINLFYRGAAADGQLAGCWVEDGQVRLSAPWTAAEVATMTGEALWVSPPTDAPAYRLAMSPEALGAWATAVDALRTIMFSSLLQRTPASNLTLTLAALQEQLNLGLTYNDARWLVTLLRTLAPPGCAPHPETLARGMAELEGLGLVRTVLMNAWQPSADLQQFAAYLKNPLPAAAIESSGAGGQYRYAIALRGDGPLWVCDFDGVPENRPWVTMRSLTGVAFLDHVRSLLAAPSVAPAAVPASELAAGSGACSACGAELRPGAAFCTKCGAAVK